MSATDVVLERAVSRIIEYDHESIKWRMRSHPMVMGEHNWNNSSAAKVHFGTFVLLFRVLINTDGDFQFEAIANPVGTDLYVPLLQSAVGQKHRNRWTFREEWVEAPIAQDLNRSIRDFRTICCNFRPRCDGENQPPCSGTHTICDTCCFQLSCLSR